MSKAISNTDHTQDNSADVAQVTMGWDLNPGATPGALRAIRVRRAATAALARVAEVAEDLGIRLQEAADERQVRAEILEDARRVNAQVASLMAQLFTLGVVLYSDREDSPACIDLYFWHKSAQWYAAIRGNPSPKFLSEALSEVLARVAEPDDRKWEWKLHWRDGEVGSRELKNVNVRLLPRD